MRQNIAVALVTVGLLLAGVLFGGVTMAVGMLVHQVSVLIVIGNAMRLLRRRPHWRRPVDDHRLRLHDPSATLVAEDAAGAEQRDEQPHAGHEEPEEEEQEDRSHPQRLAVGAEHGADQETEERP
jgi:hypothetical protein